MSEDFLIEDVDLAKVYNNKPLVTQKSKNDKNEPIK